jgi:predicted enzyme related to lactoylglutathione lyase
VITRASTVGIYVSDQDRALDFYIRKLGFEKLADDPIGGGARWIEVAPQGAETHLVLFTPPGQEDRIGTFSNVVLSCEDIEDTYEELKSRGVEFTEEPSEQPWGMWAQFRDQDGNEFGLIERG